MSPLISPPSGVPSDRPFRRPPARGMMAVSGLAMASAMVATLVAVPFAPATAEAATTQTNSCVDGAGVRWYVKTTWGDPYVASDGVTRVSMPYAGWTTNGETITTQSEVKSYGPSGTLLQTLTKEVGFDYNAGTSYDSRDPMNPPSGPGQSKVTIKVGKPGTADCVVTSIQPASAATPSPTSTPTSTPTSSTGVGTTLSATGVTATSVTVNWTGVSGATGYIVGRDGVDSRGSGAWSTTDPATARSRTFINLLSGREYTFSVTPTPGGNTRTIKVVTNAMSTPTGSSSPAPTSPAPTVAPTTGAPMPVGVAGAWTFRFADEFNGASVDTSKWVVHDGRTQNNVVTRAKNISVVNGSLVLQLAGDLTGGMVSTSEPDRRGFEAPIGSYTESRVYFPGNDSQPIFNFPAAWTSGHQWPSNGEHDYAEGLSGRLTANYHYGSSYSSHVANNSGPIAGTYPTQDAGGGHTVIFNIGKSNSRTPVTGAAGAVKVDYVRVWTK